MTTFVLTLYCTQDTSQSEPSGSAGYMLSISEAVSPSMPGKRHWGRRSKLTKEEMEPREDRARGPRPGTGHPRGRRQAVHILRGPGRRMGCLESRRRELGGCGSRRSDLGGNKAKRALEGGCFPGEDGSGGLARHSAQRTAQRPGLAGTGWPIPREGSGYLCFENLLYPIQIWGAKFKGASKSSVSRFNPHFPKFTLSERPFQWGLV